LTLKSNYINISYRHFIAIFDVSMQLQLGFSDPNDTTIRPDDHSADAYMNEFEQ
jgi:hypothetical protein